MNSNLLLRITAPAVLISLALLGTCVAGAWYIHRLQSNMAGVLTQNVRSLQAAQELEIRVRQLRFHMLGYLSDPTAERLKPVEADQQNFEEALGVVRQLATTDEQKACVQAIEEEYQKYHDEQAELRRRVAAGEDPGPLSKLVDPHPLRVVVPPCQELVRLNRARMEQVVDESRTASIYVNVALVMLGVLGPASGLVMGYGVARGLSRSLYRLSVRVQAMAQHLDRNQATRIRAASEDERAAPAPYDVGSVSVEADGDLHNLDRQLQHIVRRVEDVVGRLQEHQRDLIRAEQLSAVGQLAASVAHEVRNPLTGIKMLVEAALRGQNAQPLNLEDLQVIHREITRLEQTVQGFLNFARLPAPQRSICDLRTVVAQAMELVRARARQIKVELALHTLPEAVAVNIDPSQLETVLVNLFINALDAMPRGGQLDVTLLQRDDRGVRILVADTGSGIPAHIASRLFTPFTTTKPTGTGLGLTISGRILEEHGGSISASNRPEGGACFVINLPPVSLEAAHADAPRH